MSVPSSPAAPPHGGVPRPSGAILQPALVAADALADELAEQLATATPLVDIFDDRQGAGVLTCILPYRALSGQEGAWLEHPLMDGRLPPGIGFLLVDDGSEGTAAASIREACRRLGYSYLHIASADLVFSPGRCANQGARHARGEFILLQDLAIMPHEGFYAALLGEIEGQEMRANAKHFLVVPRICLTAAGAEAYLATRPELRRSRFLQHALMGDGAMVQSISVAASANLYQRLWYLARGGCREEIEGTQAQAQERDGRLMRHLRLFPDLPGRVSEAAAPDAAPAWKGEVAYRLFGDIALSKGLAVFATWQPPAKACPPLLVPASVSIAEPEPLGCAHAGRTLVFRPNAYTSGRQVRPLLGELMHLRDGTRIADAAMLIRLVTRLRLDRIVFFNPYQSPHMAKIYRWVRELGIPYVCAERGALPGSSFFDEAGFLNDSTSYGEGRWNRELTESERRRVQDEIAVIRSGKLALEHQAPPIGREGLRARLGVAPGEKLLFVALQRPGDTVTRCFTRGLTYTEYLEQLREFCATAPAHLRVVVKRHPLEDDAPALPGSIAAHGENINDLLAACDLVWTFNSGVGVLAMLYEKPTLLSGGAFYAFDGLNHEVGGLSEIRGLLEQPPRFDTEKSLRFLHYLIIEFYSFGRHVTRRKILTTGGKITVTLDIQYTQIIFAGQCHRYINRDEPACSSASILLDRTRWSPA